MSTNKHATIRYHALDQCFSNTGRKYFIDNLIDACNNALYEYTGKHEGVKRRQVFDDIKFMESEQGWSIPLERLKDGKKVYYRYSDKSFSIKNQAINENEVKQLLDTVSILTRFKGMPQFEWMEEILIRLETAFKLRGNNSAIVGFEQNPYLKGLNYFSELFRAIQNKVVLDVKYKGFKQPDSVDITFHPYYLKQYNGRWFIFGFNAGVKDISNLALDRIIKISETSKKYIQNKSIDFDEYFEDAIGVTIDKEEKPVKVSLQISNKLWPYIETKPIHGSQKVKSKEENGVLIELTVLPNYELTAYIFALGEEVKVISPYNLKLILKNKAQKLLNNYL